MLTLDPRNYFDIANYRASLPTYVRTILALRRHLHNTPCSPDIMSHLVSAFPWNPSLLGLRSPVSRMKSPGNDVPSQPLPEHYAMEGLLWADHHFPTDYFVAEGFDDELETYAAMDDRPEKRCEERARSQRPPVLTIPGMELCSARRLFERACARIFKRLGFLTTTFRLVAMLSMVARASAEPLDAVRICKIISVGATGMASFGASITSWQLDSKEEGNMALRVACPVLVSIFSVLYPLAFLTDKRKNKHRTRQFVEGICFGGALCLIVLRLIRPSGDEKADDDKTNNIWLDKLTFCILMIVVAGILNAERRLFTGSTNQSHNDANGTQLDTVGGPTGSSNNRRGRSDANAVNPVRNSPRQNGGQRDGQRDDSNNDDGIDYAGAAVNAADVLSA